MKFRKVNNKRRKLEFIRKKNAARTSGLQYDFKVSTAFLTERDYNAIEIAKAVAVLDYRGYKSFVLPISVKMTQSEDDYAKQLATIRCTVKLKRDEVYWRRH